MSDAGEHRRDPRLDRRKLLGLGVATLTAAGCSGGGETTTTSSSVTEQGSGGGTGDASAPETAAPVTLTPADFDGLGTCKLLPEQTPGPFPLERQLYRRAITEGYLGEPMLLGLRVVDAACSPVPDAAVEVWHCDASGDYSAFTDGGGGKDEAGDTTFLRGTQRADGDGIVEFRTIVPGWYTGRAVHVHVRVHVEDSIVLTSQMYFDADYLAGVYEGPPYAEFGLPDTTNADDGLAGDVAADGTLLHTTQARTAAGPGTLALLNLGITR